MYMYMYIHIINVQKLGWTETRTISGNMDGLLRSSRCCPFLAVMKACVTCNVAAGFPAMDEAATIHHKHQRFVWPWDFT